MDLFWYVAYNSNENKRKYTQGIMLILAFVCISLVFLKLYSTF